jgi:hypothetical protein
MRSAPLLLASTLPLAAACAGQSGNEGYEDPGQLPGAPCVTGEAALVLGTIESLGGGCVGLRVDRVVTPGQAEVEVGELVRARAGTVYAWKRTFAIGDSVAATLQLPTAILVDGSVSRPGPTSVQLLPFTDDRVQIQWGRVMLSAALDELTAPDCSEVLWERREASDDLVPRTNPTSHSTTPTAPPEDPTCE